MIRQNPMRMAGLCVVVFVATALGQNGQELVKVRATGQAPAGLPNAREAAIEDGLRMAVEAGMGVEVASWSETREYRLVRDVIITKTAGYVKHYDLLQENPNQDGLYTVRVEATITRGQIDADAEAMKALIGRKGHPRMMVVGSVDKQAFDRRLTAEIQDTLDQRNLTVIDLEMLNENQRREAERAARLELDPAKAALISREVGADYFVLVSVEGTKYPPQGAYGVSLHRVDATGIVKVIRTDTARVLASKVVNGTQRSQTIEAAMRQVTTSVLQKALREAIGRVGQHWLDDVDIRGGQQVELVLHRCTFEQVGGLVDALRRTRGVDQVMIDSTDTQGRSHMRVITNSGAADLAYVAQRHMPGLRVVSSTKYRVELESGGSSAGVSLPHWLVPAAIGGGGAAIVAVVLVMLFRKRAA